MARTKIISTIGPASDDEKTIQRLVKAGVDIFRFNFKHNTLSWHDSRMARLRKAVPQAEILVDLRGPEGRLKKKEALFEDDLAAIGLAKKHQAEWIVLSYTRQAKDMEKLKAALKAINLPAKAVAKIENQAGVSHLQTILRAADAIMIGRGDLSVELSVEKVPYWQKKIIKACRQAKKPVIVAGKMLESMIKKPEPNRIEATDMAEAIYDGADALVFSGETAIGKYPLKAVQVMKQTIDFIN